MDVQNGTIPGAMRVPREARDWVAVRTREDVIHEQGFLLDVDWWNPKIVEHGLPGGPLSTADGVANGSGWIDRRHLFSLADAAIEDETGEGALRLLWPVLLWGSGNGNRLNKKRIAAIAEDSEQAARRLREAARLSRDDSGAAFTLLRSPCTRISYFGPGFFTKYLYFAGGGRSEHPSLLIDSRVLATLAASASELPQSSRERFNYGVRTYQIACELLQRWAAELSTPERSVAADELERWAFGR